MSLLADACVASLLFCYHQGVIFGGLVTPVLTYFAVEMKLGFALPMIIGTIVSLLSFIVAILLGPETKGKVLTADLELARTPNTA